MSLIATLNALIQSATAAYGPGGTVVDQDALVRQLKELDQQTLTKVVAIMYEGRDDDGDDLDWMHDYVQKMFPNEDALLGAAAKTQLATDLQAGMRKARAQGVDLDRW